MLHQEIVSFQGINFLCHWKIAEHSPIGMLIYNLPLTWNLNVQTRTN